MHKKKLIYVYTYNNKETVKKRNEIMSLDIGIYGFREVSNQTGEKEEGPEDPSFEIWVSFMVFFVITGGLANLYFLVSVIKARSKERHGFEDSPTWFSQTIFFVNLAVVDFLYCIFFLSNGFVGLLNRNPGPGLCGFLVLTRQNLIIMEGWNTCVIAFNASFPKIW